MKRNIYLFSIIFLVIDQIIKFFVSSKMILNESIILINNFLNLTYVQNKGAAFSLFSGNRIFLVAVGVLALIIFIYYISKLDKIKEIDVFTYSLFLGGLLGNLLDRIIYGYVIDYIGVNIFGYRFPIFNFADICIVVSIILIIIDMIKEYYGTNNSRWNNKWKNR